MHVLLQSHHDSILLKSYIAAPVHGKVYIVAYFTFHAILERAE